MTLPVRILLLVLLVAALVGFGLFVVEPTEKERQQAARPAPELRFQSSTQCAACHREIFDEWHGSHHQIAYLNPEVQALSDDFRNKACQACHLPRPVAVTGYAKRTLHRTTLPDEGVSCLSCHLAADGTILARNSAPDAPCHPKADQAFASVDMCASCHNQHWTTDQWRETPFAKGGQECNACHMPEVLRKAGRKGRSHAFRASHDVASLRTAVTFRARIESDELVVDVENSGAGHNFPTEERSRAADVVVRFGKAGAWQKLHRFRLPYRSEPLPDTTLPHAATKNLRAAIPVGTDRITARLWYRLTPFCGDDDPRSALLFEQRFMREESGYRSTPMTTPELPKNTTFRPRKELATFADTQPTEKTDSATATQLPPLQLAPRLATFRAVAAKREPAPTEQRRQALRDDIEVAFLPGAASARSATLVLRGLREETGIAFGLEEALRHENATVRMHAAFELGQLARPSSVPALLLRLKYEPVDGDATVVAWLADALARLGNYAGLPFLVEQMGRRETAELAGARAIEICKIAEVKLPTQPSWDDLKSALTKLHDSWRRGTKTREANLQTRARIAEHLLNLEKFQLRGVDEARFVLRRMPNAVPLLREALRATEPYLRTHALEIVRELDAAGRSAAAELIPLLGDELTRADAARALGRVGARDAIPHLRAVLTTSDLELRAAAAAALGELGAKDAVTDLQALLAKDQPMDVQVHAAYGLALLEPPDGKRPGLTFLLALERRGAYHGPTLSELLGKVRAHDDTSTGK